MIEPGDRAADFSLPDQDGREVKLSDFRGELVVVYFYPKADTPSRISSSRRTGPGRGRRPRGWAG
ncbi:MAG TPA: redoxin domain-containing protein [Solirubrobacteraceae bacterium]|nr:redoxin domain-containing protein [Solirubrobacteraceae bacterium]